MNFIYKKIKEGMFLLEIKYLQPTFGYSANYPCQRVTVCMCTKSLQSCLTLCDPMDCNPPGFSVHMILQARILKWVAMPSSSGSSRSRDELVSHVSCICWILYR